MVDFEEIFFSVDFLGISESQEFSNLRHLSTTYIFTKKRCFQYFFERIKKYITSNVNAKYYIAYMHL